MSSALVRKSLALVDETLQKKPKKDNVFDNIMPENFKLKGKLAKNKGKSNLIIKPKKLTVVELKKSMKSKEDILKRNKEKLKLIKEATKIDLGDKITHQLIERAVNRRPVKPAAEQRKEEKTVFTEEDFKQFEEEYFDDDFQR